MAEILKPLSQEKRIGRHLMQRGDITPVEALNLYGCFRLASRIAELRDDGFVIETELQKPKHYARYVFLGIRPSEWERVVREYA